MPEEEEQQQQQEEEKERGRLVAQGEGSNADFFGAMQ
jgi:hypothetical protein